MIDLSSMSVNIVYFGLISERIIKGVHMDYDRRIEFLSICNDSN